MNEDREGRIAGAKKLIADASTLNTTNLVLAARQMRGLLDSELHNPEVWAIGVSAFERMRELYDSAGGSSSVLRVEPDGSLIAYFDVALQKARAGELHEALEICRELLWARVDWEAPWRCGLSVASGVASHRTSELRLVAPSRSNGRLIAV